MKILTLVLLMAPSWVCATPYFRLIDRHIQPVAGALLAPEDMGQSEAAVLLPLITHSPKDGCLFPSIVCEDWTPLAVGGSMNAGKITLDIAPLANILPWMAAAYYALLPAQDKLEYKLIQAQNPDPAVTFSAGPVWQYRQITNKGYFKIFVGLALHF